LDAFSGYHQIQMAKEGEEKTAFITPCGVYCYVCMPFGLNNARATFQRLMRKALGAQMGRNAEAYVDDIVVKTCEGHTFIEDLEETFVNLRKRRTLTRSRPLKKCVLRSTLRRCSASQDAWRPWGGSSQGAEKRPFLSSSS
jgi:hypothetical protein